MGAVLHVLADESLAGPVNATSPEPVTNREFARTLARTVHRPSFGFAPGWLLKLAAGPEKAREVLLSSQRAVPENLLATGFSFRHWSIEEGLRSAL